ncbi:MAG: hypothetical protein KGI82_09080, partial [Betaproteobacteria bacterium]|nr:hypothetical protein [Betaproteobacteria bacterium]
MTSPVIQFAKNAAGGVTSLSVTLNSVVAGDTLWVGMEGGGSESLTVTDSAGTLTTAALDNTTSPLHAQFAGFSAAAGTHTFTATLGTGRTCAIFAAELDPTQAASLDGGPWTPNTGSSVTVTTNTATPSASGDLAIAFVNLQSGQTNPWAAGLTDGYTAVDSEIGSSANGIWGYLTGVSAATSSGTTIPAADSWNASVILFKAASGGSTITGSSSITEGADTASATGTLAISGTASITEASDTVAATGALAIAGTAAITEGSDTVSATGALSVTGTAAITESDDTVSATGALSVTGAATITEGADTVAATGAAGAGATAAITEQPDTASATGGIALSGAASIFEGGDIVVASGGLALPGTASITEASDSVAGTGSVPTQVIQGSPQWTISRSYTRNFTVRRSVPRSFTLSRSYTRNFTVTPMAVRFPIKGTSEKVPLTFDFTQDLPSGVTLTGTPVLGVSVSNGTDSNPTGILNGAAGFNSGSTQVIQPVQGGVNGVDYAVTCTCPTTQSNLTL